MFFSNKMYKIIDGSLYCSDMNDELCVVDIFGTTIHYNNRGNHEYYYYINQNYCATHYFGMFKYQDSYIPVQLIKDIRKMIKSGVIDEELCERFYNYVDKITDKYQYIMRTEFDYVEYEREEPITYNRFLNDMYFHLLSFNLSPSFREMLQNSDDETINLAYVSLKNQIGEILNSGITMKSARKLI